MPPRIDIEPSAKTEGLADYLKTIAAHEGASSVGRKILQLQAPIEETVEWYRSQDPLDEARHFRAMALYDRAGSIIPGQLLSELNRELHQATLFEYAAANVAARTVFPHFFEPGQDPAALMSERIGIEYPEIIAQNGGVISTADIIGFCLVAAAQRPLSLKQLENLFISGEMLEYAASYNEESIYDLRQKIVNGEDFSYNPGDKHSLYVQTQSDSQIALNRLIARLMVLIVRDARAVYEQAPSVEAAYLDIKAAQFTASFNLSNPNRGAAAERREQQIGALNILIDTAEIYFTGEEALQRKFGKDPSIAGMLHEFMWYLDFNMLLHAQSDDRIIIIPATVAQDSPFVRRPVLRRGFDFRVEVLKEANKRYEYAVQLKSGPSPRNAKEYHPAIRQLKEPNFQDINPRSLRAKLRKYRDFLAGLEDLHGYRQGAEPIRKQILKTVLDEYNYIHKASGNELMAGAGRQVNEIIKSADELVLSTNGVQLNREQRRQLAKAQRRKR